MKLRIPWFPGAAPVIGAPDDAPPDPMTPHLERLRDRGVPPDAHVVERGSRVSRSGHPYWYVAYAAAGTVTVRAVLLFIDVVFEVTISGELAAILAVLDESELDFRDEVASLYQLFGEES